jgi:hypothetical protein
MHLLEAYLALEEAPGRSYLGRASALARAAPGSSEMSTRRAQLPTRLSAARQFRAGQPASVLAAPQSHRPNHHRSDQLTRYEYRSTWRLSNSQAARHPVGSSAIPFHFPASRRLTFRCRSDRACGRRRPSRAVARTSLFGSPTSLNRKVDASLASSGRRCRRQLGRIRAEIAHLSLPIYQAIRRRRNCSAP